MQFSYFMIFFIQLPISLLTIVFCGFGIDVAIKFSELINEETLISIIIYSITIGIICIALILFMIMAKYCMKSKQGCIATTIIVIISICSFFLLCFITAVGTVYLIDSQWNETAINARIQKETQNNCCITRQHVNVQGIIQSISIYEDCPFVVDNSLTIDNTTCTDIDETTYCNVPESEYESSFICNENIIESKNYLIIVALMDGLIGFVYLYHFINIVLDYKKKFDIHYSCLWCPNHKNSQYQILED